MPRLILLPFPALALVMGLAYLFGDPIRTQSPSFNVARSIAPLSSWGILFLLGAAALTASLLIGRSDWLAGCLFIGGAIYTWWATLFGVAALTDPRASLTGWAIHGFIAWSHYTAAWRVRAAPTASPR